MTEPQVIHAFALAAAAIGAGLSPLPGADRVALVPLQASLIQALADRRGVSLPRAAAAELALTLLATMAGRRAVGVALGLLPGAGVAVRAAVAASLTEALGHAALRWFDEASR